MKTISRELLPKDFKYYRSSTKIFFDYYKNYTNLIIQKIGKGFDFFTSVKLFSFLYIVTVEKLDFEFKKENLKSLNIKKAIVFRTPFRVLEKPKGWVKIPTFISKYIIHSSRSAFSILDNKNYWEKWSTKAKAHRRKILENIEKGKIRIEKTSNLNNFLDLYKNSNIRDPNKGFVFRFTKKLFENTNTSYDIFIIYVDGNPLAGAIFINDGIISEYWASFYKNESKPYHLGIAMMDVWFSNCLENGIKYCDLDHMRDSYQKLSYRGYTKFKESIADYDVYFHDTWVKIF